jgi:hypothetical protein
MTVLLGRRRFTAISIDKMERLNRRLAGWANFYQFTDYTAMVFRRLDRIVFWKLGYWLARKHRATLKALCRRWVRAPEAGRATTWVLHGRNSRGFAGSVALRRLVTSRKSQFRWRVPECNPYILREEERNTFESRYADLKPVSSRREIGGSWVGRITGSTGKSTDGERVAEGSVLARRRSNVRGAKRPCCRECMRRNGRQG